jgi:hypothetical protein
MAPAPPALGWVRIDSIDPPVTIVARLGDARPDVTAGYGGWTEVARPRRRPLSIWTGAPGLRMSFAIVFDGFRDRQSVEAQIAALERLATPTSSFHQPPRVTLTARGGMVPHQDREWVIDSLTWLDGATANWKGNRTRQAATLALFEWVPDVPLHSVVPSKKQRAKKARAKTKPGASHKRHVVHRKKTIVHRSARTDDADFGQGQDLLTIAALELGDAERWPEIAQLNGLRDPRATTPGQVLRLP